MGMNDMPNSSPRVPNAAAPSRRWRELVLSGGMPGLAIAGLATLVIRVTTPRFAILGGLDVFPMTEWTFRKADHALENC